MAKTTGAIGTVVAVLPDVHLALESAFSDSQLQRETLNVNARTFDAINTQQQALGAAFVEVLNDPTKDHDAVVRWIDLCGNEATDCSTNLCTLVPAGTMDSGVEETYKINSCIETGFTIEENKLFTSSFTKEEVLTTQFKNAYKQLLERLNTKAIAHLDANAGYNAGGSFPYSSNSTQVPASEYNVGLLPYLALDTQQSLISNATMIDGGAMYISMFNANLNAGNMDGKGDVARAQLFPSVFDINGMTKMGLGNSTFLVADYAVAFLNKSFIPETVPTFEPSLFNGAGGWKYSVTIPGYNIDVDVFMNRRCINAAKNLYTIDFVFKLNYEFISSPEGCDVPSFGYAVGKLYYTTGDDKVIKLASDGSWEDVYTGVDEGFTESPSIGDKVFWVDSIYTWNGVAWEVTLSDVSTAATAPTITPSTDNVTGILKYTKVA